MERRVPPSFLFIALLLITSPAAAQRLSDAVIPEHYTLWFAPDLEKETFRGRETIRVQITRATRTITLHAAEIEFGEVTIDGGRANAGRAGERSNPRWKRQR